MSITSATTESVGASRNFSPSQLDKISHRVNVDAAGLVLWLITAKDLMLDPAEQVYDAEDEQYHQQYADDEVQVNSH